jgi:hypothetical protein
MTRASLAKGIPMKPRSIASRTIGIDPVASRRARAQARRPSVVAAMAAEAT